MALTITYQKIEQGLSLPGAYARIANVSADKTTVRVMVSIYARAPETLRERRMLQPLDSIHVSFPLPASIEGNLMEFVYNKLKTMPQFSGSLDV